MATKKAESGTLHIDALKQGRISLRLIGMTPMYFNAMSAKAKRSLLIGGGKKTAAQRKEIKHNPEEEFWSSVYRHDHEDTFLCFPAAGVKAGMAIAALETPGVTKKSVERLVFLPEMRIRIWGKPYLKMDVVRSADINKTPDIRTRAFLPRWCSEIDIAYITPTLNPTSIISLVGNAGLICGLGDFRQEKGKGSFGTFYVAGGEGHLSKDDQSAWDTITAEGRDVQKAAMEAPEYADEETAELMALIDEERLVRAA